MLSSRQIRVMRGAVAASMATFVALLSHVVGGGEVPGLLGIVVPLIFSVLVCAALAGRCLSLWRLSISVALSQVLFHVLFVLGTPGTGVQPATMHSGHGMHGELAMLPITQASGHAAHTLHGDVTMWFWHGVAAVVTVAVLHRGERAVLRLGDLATQMVAWMRERFTAADAPLPPLPDVRSLAADWSTGALSDAPELSPWRPRGPPLTHVL